MHTLGRGRAFTLPTAWAGLRRGLAREPDLYCREAKWWQEQPQAGLDRDLGGPQTVWPVLCPEELEQPGLPKINLN